MEIAHNGCNRSDFRISWIPVCGNSNWSCTLSSYPDGSSHEKPQSIQISAAEARTSMGTRTPGSSLKTLNRHKSVDEFINADLLNSPESHIDFQNERKNLFIFHCESEDLFICISPCP